ncbi:MAG: hypothetical protein LBR82_09655 [Desulfovibrio sp.]|jgi:hypothetical protein|nr:hypothetical protein [Desulfovibrio sp.]
MWQTIEYKAAAIEQFRKGDLRRRVIDDVQSEAANAAEMMAAASGNPLILMQVKLSSDLRKLEALYSQHQRSQFAFLAARRRNAVDLPVHERTLPSICSALKPAFP